MMMRKALGVLTATALAVAGFMVAAGPAQATNGTPGTWSSTGSMSTARLFHTATLLPNGEVLVAGGFTTAGLSSAELASAELYNPTTGDWSSTGSMSSARDIPTATLLPDGEVLVAGGFNRIDGVLASAELYNPATGSWSSTGSMSIPRWLNTATLLPDGEVLVAGGQNSTGDLSSAEIYDPATGTWSGTGSMSTPRETFTATLLPNGEVLAAAGFSRTGLVASAELYNPATGAWSDTGSMSTARSEHTATLLPDGQVLVAGGGLSFSGMLASAELYNPATGTWSGTGSMSAQRVSHTATLLTNGEVLVAGGLTFTGFSTSAELYNRGAGAWSGTGSMNTGRGSHTATLLPDGEVLVAGGQLSGIGALASAELYTPQAAIVDSSITAAGMPVAATEGSPFTGTVATFTDPDTNATAAEYSATIDSGDGSSSAGTISGLKGGPFTVSGSHTYKEEGTYTVKVHITDTDSINPADATSTANVADAALPASPACLSASPLSYNGPTATFTDAAFPYGTLSDFSATINWGDLSSSSTGNVSGPIGGVYTVMGIHTYATTGNFTIMTTIMDVGGSSATTSCNTLGFSFAPGGGSFVIGDKNASIGNSVTFWGAQWAKDNSLSGVAAPRDFKGFAENPTTPSCTAGWTADPGNSTPPPDGPLPAFIAVIVTSSADQSGSTTSGNTVHIVIVKTNPGYAPDVGHAGTGVVVAQIC